MRQLISFGVVGMTALGLLTACSQEDKETKKQLATLQSQLAEQQKEAAAKEAKQRREEQEQHENEIYEQARADAKAEMEAELAAKAEQKKQATAQSAPAKPKITKKLVRYPATVVTQSGYSQLSLRGEPSAKGYEVGQVMDGDEVTVIARTNQCETIKNVEGCWVEVQTPNAKGFMFDGYLNREVLSKEEKQNITGQNDDADVEDEQ